MNTMNIVASIAARRFSARACSHAPTRRSEDICLSRHNLPGSTGPVPPRGRRLERVDPVDHALGPALGEFGLEVELLRVGAKGLHVRCVDLETLGLELLQQLGLALDVLGLAEIDRRGG